MAKTVSVGELGHGGAASAIRAAQQEPVLVSRENRPEAWIVSADRLAQIAAARGAEPAEAYQRALELIAVELYRGETLTLGQAAKLAGLDLGGFIDLCGRLRVRVLWEPERGIAAEVEGLEDLLRESESGV